ncbi:MAG: hypothetical protein Q4G69_02650 [Planctomycetia bacterium]|nr:hypothetical protein [Planctomycetia bacterium]
MHWRLFIIFSLLLSVRFAFAEQTFDLGYGKIHLSDTGAIYAEFSDGVSWPKSTKSAFSLETEAGKKLVPQDVKFAQNQILVSFNGGTKAVFDITAGKGFLLFQLVQLESDQKIKQFQLMQVPVPDDSEIATLINTAFHKGKALGVMTAAPNVHLLSNPFPRISFNNKGCSHLFQMSSDAKAGQYSARFQATCGQTVNGWSVRGKNFPSPIDLSNPKGIRVWVHGDGNKEHLKIQLTDHKGGYRDDYIVIDFKGWKQIFLNKPALNTIDYSSVAALSFYYNGLPVNKTVECLIDQVEMIRDVNGKESSVLLEDFESSQSILWDNPSKYLTVESVARHGLSPAAFGIICCPEDQWTSVIPEFQTAAGIPSPHPDGKWNKISPWVRESYFFLTGFREEQFEEALAIAKRGHFKMILLLDTWTKSHGHYEVNTGNYPDGIESLKRVIKRFNAEGIKVGLHFLAASIYYPDPYLTPVPDKRLVKDGCVKLAKDIDEKTTFIETVDPPSAEFPKTETKPYTESGRTLWIDDEMIYYDKVSVEKPYGFSGCKRGFYSTVKSSHKKDTDIWHLVRAYGYYMYDLDSDLAGEIAQNLANTANQLPLDMIYFDGSERLQRPSDQRDYWYYNAILHKNFYDRIHNKNILYQASSTSPYSWHQLARTASADGHDDLRAYLEERSGGFKSYYKTNHYPLDIGWYYAYDKKATPDMYEYVLTKSLAYDSSISLQVSVDAAKKHPFINEILDMIRIYDDLRLSGRIPQDLRSKMEIDPALFGKKTEEERNALLDKRRDYHYKKIDGKEGFQRIIFDLWKDAEPSNTNTFEFEMVVKEGKSRIGFQVQAKDQKSFQGKSLVNPKVEIAGKTLLLPMKLEVGQYGFYWGGEKLAQYGMPLATGLYLDQKGEILELPNGTYKVKFSCDQAITLPIRVRTTQQPEEFHSF